MESEGPPPADRSMGCSVDEALKFAGRLCVATCSADTTPAGPALSTEHHAALRGTLVALCDLTGQANAVLGADVLACVRAAGPAVAGPVFCIYVQALLVYERYLPKSQQGPGRTLALDELTARTLWVAPLVELIDSDDELVFRTLSVILEAFAPMLPPAHIDCLAAIGAAMVAYLSTPVAPTGAGASEGPVATSRPSTRCLLYLEWLLERGPRVQDWAAVGRKIQAVMAGNDEFWKRAWVAHCRDARYVGGWLSFVRTVLLTSEALSAELLRMLLVEQRGWIIAAMDLGDKLADVVVQALLLVSTLAACKHEVVTEALCGAGLINVVATKLVVPFERRSIFHQHVFSILRCVVESLPAEGHAKLLDGALAAWVLTSTKSVAQDSSAHSFLTEFALFLDASEAGRRFTATMPAWSEFMSEIRSRATERAPDPTELKDLLALKAKPGMPATGPVLCQVCKAHLTAYYIVDSKPYCSEHRPAQCSACRAPLFGDYVTVGFLKYCMEHAPPKCVRCDKLVSKYFQMAEGVVCLDCGAPKCVGCSGVLTGPCVTFRDSRYHPECFRCHVCNEQLGSQFLLAAEGKLLCLSCGQPSTADAGLPTGDDGDDDGSTADASSEEASK